MMFVLTFADEGTEKDTNYVSFLGVSAGVTAKLLLKPMYLLFFIVIGITTSLVTLLEFVIVPKEMLKVGELTLYSVFL